MEPSESEQQNLQASATIVIMGATGTGKSTFINLVTEDDNIRVGHTQQSETFGVQTAHYVDHDTGRSVTLIDTPGFDDSREGFTDTDILEKIVQFLEPEHGAQIHVNGIIYMHRISDPRVGGVSRKNLRMFQSLCGEENFANVRIVTTNWSRVTEAEGDHREANLRNGAFKALVDAGARMCRHTDTLESARKIMSDLIPLEAVTMKIQEEIRSGKKLSDTDAGKVLTAEMREKEKRHIQEMADLEREMIDAVEENNRALQAELEQERKALEESMARVYADRERLRAMCHMERGGSLGEQGRSERSARSCEKEMDISEASMVDQTQYDNSIGADHQVTNRSLDVMDPSGLPDMTGRDEMARPPTGEVSDEWHLLKEPESPGVERHLEVQLHELRARIDEAERKKAVTFESACKTLIAIADKLTAKGWHWWDRRQSD